MYVDDTAITVEKLTENKSEEEALQFILNDINESEFSDFLSVNEEDLYKTLGLKIDDDGTFYDPLEKDLDNDGVPDRYDHDVKDSDAFESTYDVEEKPSALSVLEKFKAQIDYDNIFSKLNQEKER